MIEKSLDIRTIDLRGKTFGRWTVQEYIGRENRTTKWLCACSCGTTRSIIGGNLLNGSSKSCGCIQKGFPTDIAYGLYKSPTYNSWDSMIQRCTNPKNDNFPTYGGKGITVCQDWFGHGGGFSNFLRDMGERPDKTSLDRIDNAKGYSLENCRWSNLSNQIFNQNTRVTNTSGRTGVGFDYSRNKWHSSITVNYKPIFLGRYSSFEQAVDARERAELKYFGYVKEG